MLYIISNKYIFIVYCVILHFENLVKKQLCVDKQKSRNIYHFNGGHHKYCSKRIKYHNYFVFYYFNSVLADKRNTILFVLTKETLKHLFTQSYLNIYSSGEHEMLPSTIVIDSNVAAAGYNASNFDLQMLFKRQLVVFHLKVYY